MSGREALLYVGDGSVWHERGTFHTWELFWIRLASTTIVPPTLVPLQLGISGRQKFSHHFECDSTRVGHSTLPLITEHLQVWGLCSSTSRELSHKPDPQLDSGCLVCCEEHCDWWAERTSVSWWLLTDQQWYCEDRKSGFWGSQRWTRCDRLHSDNLRQNNIWFATILHILSVWQIYGVPHGPTDGLSLCLAGNAALSPLF